MSKNAFSSTACPGSLGVKGALLSVLQLASFGQATWLPKLHWQVGRQSAPDMRGPAGLAGCVGSGLPRVAVPSLRWMAAAFWTNGGPFNRPPMHSLEVQTVAERAALVHGSCCGPCRD